MNCRKIFAVCLGIGFSVALRADIQPILLGIEESRSAAFVEERDWSGRTEDALRLTLSLKSPEAEEYVKYGNVKIEEAVDDKGASLMLPKDSRYDPLYFREYSNAFFRRSALKQKGQPPAPQLEIILAKSQRAASRIARLRGSCQLATEGTLKTFQLDGLNAAGPHRVDIPADVGVGVTATVNADMKSIGIEFKGDENLVDSIELVDAAGRNVSSVSSSSSSDAGPAHHAIVLWKPIGAGTKLVVTVVADRKLTTIPFDLKDVPLP